MNETYRPTRLDRILDPTPLLTHIQQIGIMRWTLCVSGILLITACSDAPTGTSAVPEPDVEIRTPVILGKIVRNTINPIAILTQHGHHLIVTGPISCTAGEWAELRVTVTQRVTGAVAEGRGRNTCTGGDQTWEVQLQKVGKEAFEEGAAIAVAFARTFDGGKFTDAHQWLVNMTLTE